MIHAREDYNRIQDPAGLIPAGEPVFLIRAQDACATWTLAHWIKRARYIKAGSAIIQAAADQLDRMYAWQEEHGVKVPDLAGASVGVSSRALADIVAERRRQVEVEDCTPESDDKYRDGEMARAAGIYAIIAGSNLTNYRNALGGYHLGDCLQALLDHYWPFHRSWFKPTSRRRDLVKAGALIVAEIERLDRESGQ